MITKIIQLYQRYKIHFLVWILYMLQETVVIGILFNSFGNPFIYLVHYLVSIFMFYLHSDVVLPIALIDRRKAWLVVPIAVVLQLAVYVLLHFMASYALFSVDIGTVDELKLDRTFVLRNLYRGLLFMGFATGYYFFSTYLKERTKSETLQQEKLITIIEAQKMKQELADAQNAFLKAQINPHFLFNTLDFVYHSINQYSPVAGESIIRLADMMRYAISAGELGSNVRLAGEIEQVENLIYLYQVRRAGGLAIEFRYTPECGMVKLIPLVLLTLVENMFKHGYIGSNMDEAARIQLEVRSGYFSIRTVNLIGRSNIELSNRTGLKNVDERMKNAYGTNFKLDYGVRGKFFEVNLQVPLALIQDYFEGP